MTFQVDPAPDGPRPVLAYEASSYGVAVPHTRVILFEDGQIAVARQIDTLSRGAISAEDATELAREAHEKLRTLPRYLGTSTLTHQPDRRMFARKGEAWIGVCVYGQGDGAEAFEDVEERVENAAESATTALTPTEIGIEMWSFPGTASRPWPADLPPLPEQPNRWRALYTLPIEHADRLRALGSPILHNGEAWIFYVRHVLPGEAYVDRVRRAFRSLPHQLGQRVKFFAKNVSVKPEDRLGHDTSDGEFLENAADDCFAAQLEVEPPQGEVRLKAAVALDGRWTAVTVTTNFGAPAASIDCFKAKVAALHPSPRRDGNTLEVDATYFVQPY